MASININDLDNLELMRQQLRQKRLENTMFQLNPKLNISDELLACFYPHKSGGNGGNGGNEGRYKYIFSYIIRRV
jgi:hypothetical protein